MITKNAVKFACSTLLVFWFLPVASAQSMGNWTEQQPQTSPSGRTGHRMVYDSAHGQAVMFGGENDFSNPFSDTWVWDGKNWIMESPQTMPSGRFEHAMAYDSKHNQVVLFGGAHPGLLNDTWVWDGTNWTDMNPANSPSSQNQDGRSSHAMAYDSAHGQVVLFGGVVYFLSEAVMVEDLNDTWLWDGTNWTQASPTSSPPARFYMAMTYDSAHGQVVMFGGTNLAGTYFSDTWVWDGTNWTEKNPQHSPPARLRGAMAFDSTHGQVVMFGGFGSDGNTILGDTWTWDGSDWTQQSPQTSPPATNAPALAYDSMHDQVAMFGGFYVVGSDVNTTNTTWTWMGAAAVAVPVVTAVVNGASFQGGGVVPGEIATAFGTNLTSSAGITVTSGLPLPTMFLTDSLIVNNNPVALFAVDNVSGQQQINFQVPWEVASGPKATIAVSNNGTSGASISVPVLTAQPGIFNYAVGTNTFGAILHSNYQLANTANPAKPDETVLIYCTGLGAVASPPADGEAGNGQPTMVTPTVTIGGTNAIVSFSGLAPGFVGLYQVNAEVPAGTFAGNQAVVVEVGGVSSNSVLLPVA